jgi:hypothetical protein
MFTAKMLVVILVPLQKLILAKPRSTAKMAASTSDYSLNALERFALEMQRWVNEPRKKSALFCYLDAEFVV